MIRIILDLIAVEFLFAFCFFLYAGIEVFDYAKSAFHEIFAVMWIICTVLSLGFFAVILALVHPPEQNKKEAQ